MSVVCEWCGTEFEHTLGCARAGTHVGLVTGLLAVVTQPLG